MSRRGRPQHDDILTPAEWRVVNGVRHGLSDRAIAARRSISRDAIKFHVGNILQKLGLKDRAALRLWSGAPRDSALHKRDSALHKKEKVMNAAMLGPVGQISRTVQDIEKARHWYGTVLGLPHLYSFGDLAFFDMGGTRLYLTRSDTPAQQESIIYFRVADIRGVYESLEAKGVKFRGAPHMIYRHPDGTEEWMAFFPDPEDRLLAIMAQVTGDAGSAKREA